MPPAARTSNARSRAWKPRGNRMASRTSAMRAAGGRAAAARPSAQLHTGHPAALIATISCLLVVVGLVMILSASSVTSFANYGSSFLFFKRQLVWAVAGMALFVIFCRLDYRRLKGFGYVLYPIALVLLVVTLIPGVGVTVGGGTRWIALGALSFQPSELAKLALVLFSADVFSRKHERLLQEPSHMLIPMVPALGLMAALVLRQPDLGTTPVSYTHLRAHETDSYLVCRLLLEKKKT